MWRISKDDTRTALNWWVGPFMEIAHVQLQSYAEAVDGCRHIAIARYFGESKIDEKDEEHLKAYCDKMCDVSI